MMPTTQEVEDVLERAVGRVLRRSKDRELLRILRPAEPLDLFADPGQLGSVERLLPPIPLRDGDRVAFEPEASDAERVGRDRGSAPDGFSIDATRVRSGTSCRDCSPYRPSVKNTDSGGLTSTIADEPVKPVR